MQRLALTALSAAVLATGLASCQRQPSPETTPATPPPGAATTATPPAATTTVAAQPAQAPPTDFEQLANRRRERWFRVFNELAILLFAATVILVVVKPF